MKKYMYNFILEFLTLPYNLITGISAKQYAIGVWCIIGLFFSIISLAFLLSGGRLFN